jgi:prepilin peptidase CpaA
MLGRHIAVMVGLLAASWDIKTRRIPNKLTFSAIGIAILMAAFNGLSELWTCLLGIVVGFLILFLPYLLLGGIGEGDLKLMAAFGALGGPQFAFWSAVYGSILGGIGALTVVLMSSRRRRVKNNIQAWLLGALRGGSLSLPTSEIFIPYAPFLAMGAILALLWQGGIA